jgi:hypothetical protein
MGKQAWWMVAWVVAGACVEVGDDGVTVDSPDGGGPAVDRRERSWSDGLATLGGGGAPDVAFARAGHAEAVLVGEAGISSVSFDAATGRWALPVAITDADRGELRPRVAAGANGAVVAAWDAAPAGEGTLRVAWRRADGSWDPPSTLGAGHDVDVAVDGRGAAVLVWRAPVAPGGPDRVWAVRLERGDAVADASLIGGDDDVVAGRPRLALAPGGEALVAWTERGELRAEVRGRRLVGGAWSAPVRLDDDDTRDASDPWPAMTDGRALVMWTERAGKGHAVVARALDGDDWSALATVHTTTYRTGLPRVTLGRDGAAVAAWVQHDRRAWTSRHDANGAWERAQPLGSAGWASDAQVVADREGEAVAVWSEQFVDASRIRARVRAVGGAWGEVVTLHTVAACVQGARLACRGFPAGAPRLAMSATGDAVVVWQQSDGVRARSYR